MKLVIVIVQDKDAPKLLDHLTADGIQVTKLASTGGFLKEGNTTLMIGVEEERLDFVIDTVKKHCHAREQLVTPLTSVVGSMDAYMPYPVEVQVGGATIFVLPVERFEKA